MLMLVSSPPFVSWHHFLDTISTEERHHILAAEKFYLNSRPRPDPIERDYEEMLSGYTEGYGSGDRPINR